MKVLHQSSAQRDERQSVLQRHHSSHDRSDKLTHAVSDHGGRLNTQLIQSLASEYSPRRWPAGQTSCSSAVLPASGELAAGYTRVGQILTGHGRQISTQRSKCKPELRLPGVQIASHIRILRSLARKHERDRRVLALAGTRWPTRIRIPTWSRHPRRYVRQQTHDGQTRGAPTCSEYATSASDS